MVRCVAFGASSGLSVASGPTERGLSPAGLGGRSLNSMIGRSGISKESLAMSLNDFASDSKVALAGAL